MAIRVYKPTSSARRFMSVLTYEEITKKTPEKSLTEYLKKNAGRNKQGKITVRHQGGGNKVKYRIIDFKRDKRDIPAKVAAIEYDPNRSAFIALLNYADGEKRYILAPLGLNVGDTVLASENADIKPGNALPVSKIPVGTLIHNVEIKPGRGGQMVRSAGAYAQLMAKEGAYAQVRLPSSEVRMVPMDAYATIGTVGNTDHENVRIGKAGARLLSVADELAARCRDMRNQRRKRGLISAAPANGTIDLEEMAGDHFARGLGIYKLLLVCFLGSFAGVVVELGWCLIRNGYLESRSGLVYGPFNLLYGAGAVALTVCLYRFRNRGNWLSFLGGMLVGTVVEYLCSWGQEVLFGSRSWDYSHMPFNLNGRVCLLYSVFWGILGVLWIKDLYPRMAQLILKLPNKLGKILTVAVTVFLIFDSLVSLAAVARWAERVHGQPASSAVETLLDERFPNDRMEKIYANMDF